MLFTFSYSLEQFTLLRTFRICWTLGQRDIIPISCLSSTRISNEYVTFTNLFHQLYYYLLCVIYSQDLRGEIQKIGRFLGKYPNEHQLNRMVEHLRIDKFATNKSVNFEHYRWLNFMSPDGRFIRNGELSILSP